jgi:hypothetical protein
MTLDGRMFCFTRVARIAQLVKVLLKVKSYESDEGKEESG